MKMDPLMQQACLSHWFPLLRQSGVLVPETRIVEAARTWNDPEEGMPPDELQALVTKIHHAAEEVGGYPCFLRTGHGSGKHEWRETCFLPRREDISDHIQALVYWSAIVDFFGLPTKVWVVRELLPLASTFTAFAGFPVNIERRYFIEGGHVVCHHGYWPEAAVEEGSPTVPDWKERLAVMNLESPEEVAELTALSKRVSLAVPGAWSLDWAKTTDGRWVAIDMAPAGRSYHWPGCPVSAQLRVDR